MYTGDAVITTDNAVLLRTTKELIPIICEQKSIPKKKITEKQLRIANKNGFGNEVGSVTNKCTGMFDVLATFEKGTDNYNTMEKRIMCMQAYQQEVIDSVKGCIAKEVPKHWYSYNELKVDIKNDSEEVIKWKTEQLSLASYKKPYFFIYNYSHMMTKYKKYLKDSNANSIIRFRLSLDELYKKENKLPEELDFLKYYEMLMPVFMHKSTMNRICWKLEEKFKDVKLMISNSDKFDINIMKSVGTYPMTKYEEIKKVYDEYKTEVKQYMITSRSMKSEEKKEKRNIFISKFKKKAFQCCGNKYTLCNILIDMCYSNKESKQFVWDICGKTIIENLLNKNGSKIYYPIITETEEDFVWNGEKYKIIEQELKEEV